VSGSWAEGDPGPDPLSLIPDPSAEPPRLVKAKAALSKLKEKKEKKPSAPKKKRH
jgi:hypothetical protein